MQDRHPEPVLGRLCLWDGVPLLLASPLRYLILVILLPAGVVAAIVATLATPAAAVAAFLGGAVFMWLFQLVFFR